MGLLAQKLAGIGLPVAGLSLAVILASAGAVGAEPSGSARPVVVELFTSQGCSSCPPVEALLGELVARRDVVALAFHVDYWDGLGWTDRFDLPLAAQRQWQYARRLHLSTVYTPQLVVDGRDDVAGFERGRVTELLGMPRTGVPVRVTVDGAALRIRVAAVDAPAPAPQAEVLLVPYLRQADTAVGRGENSGRLLREYHIVRAFKAVGRWQGTAAEWNIPLKSLPGDATDVAVLVQQPDSGAMLGAASMPLSVGQ